MSFFNYKLSSLLDKDNSFLDACGSLLLFRIMLGILALGVIIFGYWSFLTITLESKTFIIEYTVLVLIIPLVLIILNRLPYMFIISVITLTMLSYTVWFLMFSFRFVNNPTIYKNSICAFFIIMPILLFIFSDKLYLLMLSIMAVIIGNFYAWGMFYLIPLVAIIYSQILLIHLLKDRSVQSYNIIANSHFALLFILVLSSLSLPFMDYPLSALIMYVPYIMLPCTIFYLSNYLIFSLKKKWLLSLTEKYDNNSIE